jgi:hypothetical protein
MAKNQIFPQLIIEANATIRHETIQELIKPCLDAWGKDNLQDAVDRINQV